MIHTDAALSPEEIQQISLSPYFIKIRPTLIKILKNSRAQLTPIKLLELEFHISSEIIKVEKQISYFSKSADRETHNDEWFSREVYKAHRRILKNIADGIAWRYLKCRRAPLRLIAEHNQTGHLSKNFVEEAKDAERIVNQSGAHLLLNDITNVLRYGDLTIIQDNGISFYEVKSGPKDGRAYKQAKKLDSVLDMLNSKEHTIGDQTAKVLLVESRPTHLTNLAEKVILDALKGDNGISYSRLSPYLWFSCISMDKMIKYYRKKGSLPSIPTCPFKKGRYTVPFINGMLFDSYSPNIAPYSIFPFDEEIIIDLLFGSLQIKAQVSEDELVKSFRGKGWDFKFPSIEAREEWLSFETPSDRIAVTRSQKYQPSLSQGAFTTVLPWDIIYRIGFEFLSIKAIIEMIEVSRDSSIQGKPDFVVTEFLNEKDRWI
jgi:hypothetical protein